MKKNSIVKGAIFLNLNMVILYVAISLIILLMDFTNLKLFFSTFIYAIFASIFIIYLHNHVSYKKQRTYFVIVASLMLLFLLFRGLKYGAFDNVDVVSRHLWYLYYGPTLFIPFFLLCSSFSIINKFKKAQSIVLMICAIISTFIFVVILTNDLHQLAFSFKEDFLNWNDDYKRGFFYYFAFIWSGLLIVGSFLILVIGGNALSDKRHNWLALIPLFIGLAMFLIDIIGLSPKIDGRSIVGAFPEVMCFMIAGFILTSMKLGLITSNDDYAEMFKRSSFPAYVVDKNQNIIYSSAVTRQVDKSLWPKQNENITIENDKIYNLPISGGSVIWFENIKEINDIKKELDDTNERLKEEEQIRKLNNALREEKAITKEKNALYDAIANETIYETNRIMELSKEVEDNPSLFKKNMALVCFYSSYIKRLSNLKLIAAEKKKMAIDELYLSTAESLRFVEKSNIRTFISDIDVDNNEYDSELIIYLYKTFQKILEDTILNVKAISVFFNNHQYKIMLEGQNIIINNDNDWQVEQDDDCYYLSFDYKGDQ